MSDIIIRARNIAKAFGGNRVLDGVSFDLRKGEIVLLRGANGSGKTTLINILTGNLEPDSGEICIYNKKETVLKFPRPWYRRVIPFAGFSPESIACMGVGRVWQDVRIFASQTVRDNVAVAASGQPGESVFPAVMLPFRVRRQEQKNSRAALDLLETLGVEHLADLTGGEISFGQSKKVAIARALHGKAKVLFLDEPLAGLDKAECENAIAILKKLSSDFGITMVIIEHDLNIARIKEIATTYWNLRNGKMFIGESEENMTAPNTELLDWLESLGNCQEVVVPGGEFRIVRRSGERKEILIAESLTIKRNGRTVIETPLNFSLCEGDIALLQAPNGWGKSSLLETVSGLLPLNSGRILHKGTDISNIPIWDRAKKGLHLTRTCDTLFSHLTVEENLRLNGISQPVMPDKSKRKAGSLSGGESRRLMLECALKSPSGDILLLDEPFQALDTETSAWLRKNIENTNKTFLITMPGTAN